MEFRKACELHKRIMKHDLKAVDEIETLDAAKEIIKMMYNNIYQQYYQERIIRNLVEKELNQSK